MKLEIVEFYPLQPGDKRPKKPGAKGELLGTMHVYLIDFDLDIRGVRVIKNKGKGRNCVFLMPNCKAIDEDTKESVVFPVVNFPNKNKHKDFIDSLYKSGNKFLQEREKKKNKKPSPKNKE